MRPFEIALTISILALAVMTLLLRQRSLPRGLYALPAMFALVHAIPLVEGARWQMAPAYLAALLLLVLAGQPAAYFRRGLVKAALGLTLFGALLAVLLPVGGYPAPTGPYEVGTTVRYLVDRERTEIYGDDPDAPRELVIQIWYPIESVPDRIFVEHAPVILDAGRYADAFAREFRLPAFVMSHVGLLDSHSSLMAAPGVSGSLFISEAEDAYPVIVGSHGWRGFRALHTPQFEALASHGYIAVGIDHTYGAMATVLRDGRVVPYDPGALPSGVSDEEYDLASTVLEDVYEADIRFVLDELERMNDARPFEERLDLSRIGLVGHSTGGGAVVQACQSDARCKAGFVMDAWVEPIPAEQRAQGLEQPFIFMRSETWSGNDNDGALTPLIDASADSSRLAIAGTGHRDFTLQGILSPLLQLIGFTGTLEPLRTLDIVNAYMVAFFDHTLKGAPAPLLEGASVEFPEVSFD